MTPPLLHHLSLGVSDLQAMSAFYDAVLAPLGQVRVWDRPRSVGYGFPGQGDKLLLNLRDDGAHPPGAGFHLAFGAAWRDAVDRFHAGVAADGAGSCAATEFKNSMRIVASARPGTGDRVQELHEDCCQCKTWHRRQ